MSKQAKPKAPAISGDDAMSDADLGAFVRKHHVWLNAFTIVRPSDETLIAIGQIVVDALWRREVETDTLGVRGMACALWFNAS